ncbi:XapX domain-containing protein [Streptomyces sp. NPDC059701]|uniref:XapX domain-containing protein n=1 Tax=Streptomyces sp. NPDC059701 TaxID=3346914 RepID=UPI0036A82F8C
MSPPEASRRTAVRAGALSFGAGLLMGAVYWALDLSSPAPPLLGLAGLAGIVLGERAATAVRDSRVRRLSPPHDEGTTRVH